VIPERAARCVPGDDRRVTVATPDVVMVHLDFGNQRYGQVLSSFATAASKAPAGALPFRPAPAGHLRQRGPRGRR
jgi:hypothetical protein